MVLQNLGRKLSFGVGSDYSGWHQNVFRILPLIVGIAALATTLLLGSYLWGLVTKRKNKNRGERPAPSPDFYPRTEYNISPKTILPLREFLREGTGKNNQTEREGPASLADSLSRADKPRKTLSFRDFHPYGDHKTIRPNTILSFREFDRAPASFSPKVAAYDNNDFSDEFDAEDDCAEVLAEARFHAADVTQTKAVYNSPGRYQSVQSWLSRSPDMRHQSIISVEDAEEVFARNQAERFPTHQQKASKPWKKLLFWKRSKKNNQFEFHPTCGAISHSSRTTPIHHLFLKSSRTRATVGPSTTLITSNKDSMNSRPKRSTSSPIYYDGSPYTPNKSYRPYSSPLSPYSTPSRDGLYEPTYIPLTRPYNNYRSFPSPLYTP